MSAVLPLANITGAWSWLIILFIALLLFGKRLPGVARNLGRGITEFKKGLGDGGAAIERLDDEVRDPPVTTPPRERAKTDIDQTSV
ncbi:MAG TPA: twin-arginine translocase TatA/TatE family subunit [Planctomycetota bacterium]|nr:twin-arginine translocase TatA/TatE family subunit [Planctomycetota bacterium]